MSGVAVDSHDNIWVIHRPRTTDEHDKYLFDKTADCCAPAPAVLEFDQTGNLIQSWGGPAVQWAVSTLGVMVVIVGLAMFLRQVRFTGRNVRLTAAQIAMRTYLARRAPAVRPFMYLPVEDDRGVFPGGKMSWINQSLGLPGTTALINSALVALIVGLALGGTPWSIIPAALVFLVFLTAQVAYVGRARAAWARDIRLLNEARGIHPSDRVTPPNPRR